MTEALRHVKNLRTGDLSWREGEESSIAADPAAWGDVVLARKETPTSYHLSVVVDDALQGVTHVARGRDLYPSTSVHRLLQELLGLSAPFYRHHRLILRFGRPQARQIQSLDGNTGIACTGRNAFRYQANDRFGTSMIPKSGDRFSEKIMLKQGARARRLQGALARLEPRPRPWHGSGNGNHAVSRITKTQVAASAEKSACEAAFENLQQGITRPKRRWLRLRMTSAHR